MREGKLKMEEIANGNIMVSVCVMSYNLEKYIAEALDSILMQKVNFKYNIVVGDDCSTDKTRQILQKYLKKYPDTFTLLLHEKNLGIVANFAATLKACHGKYIALLDGDDYWTDPLKLQKQVDFLESNKEYSMVFHDIELHDQTPNGVIVKPFNLEKNNREYTYDEITNTWLVGTCSVLCINNEQYRYIENNLWFPVQALQLYLCCASKGKIYYLSETMSVYRRLLSGSMNSKEFADIGIHLTFIKYYQTLYNDFNHLLSEETINRQCANHYLFAARKSRKNKNKEDYIKYLALAMTHDPQYIYEKEINTTLINADKKFDNLQHKYNMDTEIAQQKLNSIQNKYNLIMVSISNLIKVSAKRKIRQKISAYKSLKKTYDELQKAENENRI